MKKEKRKKVFRKMIPSFSLLGVIAILLTAYLLYERPFVDLNENMVDSGKINLIETTKVLGGKGSIVYFITLDNSNSYYVNAAVSTSWINGIDYNDLMQAKENETVITVYYSDKYVRNGSYNAIEIHDEYGNIYFSCLDTNIHKIVFWCVIWGLYIIFGGFYVFCKWNLKYKETKPGDI